ncbi:hypothetical protein [Haloterrigena salina]|nr:hypothetical protein [Haloterrigena salina]
MTSMDRELTEDDDPTDAAYREIGRGLLEEEWDRTRVWHTSTEGKFTG